MKNKLFKFIFTLVIGVAFLAYLNIKTSVNGDARLVVQAVHTCSSTGQYTCSGGCNDGYACNSNGYGSCNCNAVPYCDNWHDVNCLYGCTASLSGGTCKSAPAPYCLSSMVAACGTLGCIPNTTGGYCGAPSATPFVTSTTCLCVNGIYNSGCGRSSGLACSTTCVATECTAHCALTGNIGTCGLGGNCMCSSAPSSTPVPIKCYCEGSCGTYTCVKSTHSYSVYNRLCADSYCNGAPDPTSLPTALPTVNYTCDDSAYRKCVYNLFDCDPSTTYGYSCPSGNKCVISTASCSYGVPTSTPTPIPGSCTTMGSFQCVQADSICGSNVSYPYDCPGTDQKCVSSVSNTCVVPTPGTCVSGDVCGVNPYCVTTSCDTCGPGPSIAVSAEGNSNGKKIIRCYTSVYCKEAGISCSQGTYDDSIACANNCFAGKAVNTPTPFCQPYTCTDTCGLGGCPGGCGNIDNCGGVDCVSCGNKQKTSPTPGVKPTSIPGCTPDCSSDPCRITTCSGQTCLGACNDYCYGSMSCTAPTFSTLMIYNADSVLVNPDVDNQNHICETTFDNSSNPRRIIFRITVSDLDGYSDISTVELRWNGTVYNASFVSGSGENAIYTATANFTSGQNNVGTYPVEVRVTDSKNGTSGWVESGNKIKIWDCQVPVSGMLYDGSAGQACNTTGFTDLVGSNLNFINLLFRSAVAGTGVSATVSLPNSYGTNNLSWNKTYLPIFNGGSVLNPDGNLQTVGRMTRIVDLGNGTTSCPTNDEFDIASKVSPYSDSPSVKIDFSFVHSMAGWFQVVGAGVKAKNEISSGVPSTANALEKALSISSSFADNGLVSFSSFRNINANNDNTGYGISNNWWVNRNTNDTTAYSYQYFYNNLFINRDMGTTGSDWAGKPSEGIYFVNGNLNIDSNFLLNNDKTILFVVKGNITIADTVDRVDGIFISDGGITASGTSNNQLVINGILFSRKNIRLNRSYTAVNVNNVVPAVKINYRPDLIFNMPGTLMRVLSGWREE